MNLKSLGSGAAIAATAMFAVGSPAQALNLAGKTLTFNGDVRIDDLGNGVDNNAGGQIRFNFGDGVGSVFDDLAAGVANVGRSSDPVFGGGPLTIKDLILNQTGANTWSLAASPLNDFITGLATANPSSFDLTAFTLTRLFSNGVASYSAEFEGIFDPPGLAGGGGLTTQRGALTIRGTTFSADITAVPTPALLPAAVGFGAAMLRKRKGEQAEAEKEAIEVKA